MSYCLILNTNRMDLSSFNIYFDIFAIKQLYFLIMLASFFFFIFLILPIYKNWISSLFLNTYKASSHHNSTTTMLHITWYILLFFHPLDVVKLFFYFIICLFQMFSWKAESFFYFTSRSEICLPQTVILKVDYLRLKLIFFPISRLVRFCVNWMWNTHLNHR